MGGVIVRDLSITVSNYRANLSLDEYLKQQKVGAPPVMRGCEGTPPLMLGCGGLLARLGCEDAVGWRAPWVVRAA